MVLFVALALVLSVLNFYFYFSLEGNMSADRAALDAKIQEVATKYDTTIADIKKVIADLQAKIDAGNQPLDFQAEVDALQAVVDKETADDPGASNA